MIEVMSSMGVMIPESVRSSKQDCADVADRLIEAGFGRFEKICGVCSGKGSFPIPCPDNNPGCCVAHYRTCQSCNGTGKQQ